MTRAGRTVQSKRSQGRKRLSCLILGDYDSDLIAIEKLLWSKGIQPVLISDLPSSGVTLSDKMRHILTSTDLVIAIIDPDAINANVVFELGYALALRKRPLIIARPGTKELPVDVMDMPYIRADIHDTQAIGSALDIMLEFPETKKSRPTQLITRGAAIGRLANTLIDKLLSLGSEPSEQEITEIVLTALKAGGLLAFSHAGPRDMGVDISVWNDEWSPSVGNPFLIEIKRSLSDTEQFLSASAQVSAFLQKSNARWALVLYLSGPLSEPKLPELRTSRVLFLRVRDLLNELRNNSFAEVVRHLRNRRAHGTDL